MCSTCGCNQPEESVTFTLAGETNHHHGLNDQHLHDHNHGHNHSHHHSHNHGKDRELSLELDILQKNNLLAERNRGFFEAKNILAINLVSSPGSGKTSLLEKSIGKLNDKAQVYVIEGDQQTMNDANRINKAGAKAIQINTGLGCHLDSHMIHHAIQDLNVTTNSMVFIENVGNLVCPGLFDLGEGSRVVVISTTEGDDKPMKYPTMFETSNLCIINKIDLLPYVNFDIQKVKESALRINPKLEFIELSCSSEEGLDEWLIWLKEKMAILTE